MSSQADSSQAVQFKAGADALAQKRYAEAISALERYCQGEAAPSQRYYQAQMWLVKAYHEMGDRDRAQQLCQELTTVAYPQVQSWAEKTLRLLFGSSAPGAAPASARSGGLPGGGLRSEPPPTEPPTLVDRTVALRPEPDPYAEVDGEVATPMTSASDPAGFAVTAPSGPSLTAEEAERLYTQGVKAVKQSKFAEAIAPLEQVCQGAEPKTTLYGQAQMALAKAYIGAERQTEAIALCEALATQGEDYLKVWAKRRLADLRPAGAASEAASEAASGAASAEAESGFSSQDSLPETAPSTRVGRFARGGQHGQSASSKSPSVKSSQAHPGAGSSPSSSASSFPKAGRSERRGVKVSMQGVAMNLTLASGVTLSLLSGMVLSLVLTLLLIHDAADPTQGLAIAIGITVAYNLIMFFVSPWIMDLVQGWLYGTHWVPIQDIQRYSPESARIIREVCAQKKIKEPRLGIIEDQTPTAFTYGSLPNSARLVVSRGLFTYLDDDEVATVYAHELGHIVHWDFAVMTLAATLVQIMYLIYSYAREIGDRLGNSDGAKKIKGGLQAAVVAAYVCYIVGQYALLFLSRTREYYADHFAAEVTGNPNGLSRALVKIAYGIVEEGKRSEKPSKVLQGTRALGIADSTAAGSVGTAYRVASEPGKVGRVFLWDMFNPWARWMELNSTHPLTGKRVRALSTYAEQLGLEREFDMANVMREGKKLSKQRLYGSFVLDVLLMSGDRLGALVGVLVGGLFASAGQGPLSVVFGGLFGFGLGTLIQAAVMYPDFTVAAKTDMMSLMSDPYASPLRGKPVRLEGKIIGRGDAGRWGGCDLQFQDPSGMVFLHYVSRWGALGNLLFGLSKAENFINCEVSVTGWFRRGVASRVDLKQMDNPAEGQVKCYHRFWRVVTGSVCLLASFILPVVISL